MGRVLRAATALAVLAAVTVGTGAQAAERPDFRVRALQGQPVNVAKSLTARIAQSDQDLLAETGNKTVNVMVRLDYDPVASYFGGVEGLKATSPETTGKPLAENTAAVDAYRRHLTRIDNRVRAGIRAAVPEAEVGQAYHIAFGGLAARLPANRAKDLLAVDGVVAVMRDGLSKPLTNVTPEFVGATKVWPTLGGPILAGSDVVVGVLDTGVWPEHSSYLDKGLPAPPGGPYGCEFGDGSDPDLGAPFACNDKLVGSYAFLDTYTSFINTLEGEFCADPGPPTGDPKECSARDDNGHGTHTSTTAAGDVNPNAEVFGVPRGTVAGMAPGGRVIMYKVCLDLGCFDSDMIAAVEQSIVDDIDAMNVSIGPFGPPYSDPTALAFLDAYAAGITVSVSAGNSGPGAGTSSDPGPWTIVVGASTSPRKYSSVLHVRADNGDMFSVEGSTITDGVMTPTDLVDAADLPGYNDSLCLTPLPAGSVTGKVVACERGIIARVEKSFNAMEGGAVGMVLWNSVSNQTTNTDNHWIPTVHLGGASDGADFNDFIDSHTGEKAVWEPGIPNGWQPDVMADFSSRGPAGEFLKPDVTAPGVQILAGHTPEPSTILGGPPGELFQAIAGTSMSSPHTAGVAALVKDLHAPWSPSMIKSVIVTTGSHDVFKEDGTTPADPFDMGGGSIRANRAVRAPLAMHIPSRAFFDSADDPLSRIHLNTPTINASPMPGQISTHRTFTNITPNPMSFKVETTSDTGQITASPSSFSVAPGASKRVNITISAPTSPDGQYFGWVGVRPTGGGPGVPVVLPVAFLKEQGVVAVTNECDDTSLNVGQSATCTATFTNNATESTNFRGGLKPTDASVVTIDNVSPPATPVGNTSWMVTGNLDAATPPSVDAIAPGGTGIGYVPLGLLGVPPIGGVGDETIVNVSGFLTGDILFGSEPYDTVGLVSNGYAVMGGGAGDDVNFVPQSLPDPARPNNVLAPFWTDLDPSAGGKVYAAELCEVDCVTGRNWVVLEWEKVPVFGSTQLQSFQIWMQTGDTEFNSFEYGNLTGSGSPDGLTVGAENRDGSSGAQAGIVPPDGSAAHVETSPPISGGIVTVTYDATGAGPGQQTLLVGLQTQVQNGVNTAGVNVTVS